jgi:tape measure domain-containing protein
MAFNAGELVATIRLDGVAQFKRDTADLGTSFSGVGTAANKAGALAANVLKAAAAATVVATAATAGYITSLFNTGVAYNTLQQTSRAALKTLLGGSVEVNAQMDKLDAFARTSPFSKSIFISAQQQLLGFGMEAGKVIPTLDALQNAIAAVGGTSQDLESVTFVLAQIQASGKITGQDLLQLGSRGINAADLIGGSLGKTGAQIKESISEGSLGAQEAIDALTAGMATKFAGAAENVKGTFTGTIDRINAASREIGSALAAPFVSAAGGGLYVTWGNQVADIMRSILTHTTPIVNMMLDRVSPAFAGFTRTLDGINVSIKSWDSSRLEGFLNKIGDYTPLIAGVGSAFAVLGAQSLPVVGKLFAGLSPLPVALLAIAATNPQIREAGLNLLKSFEPLLPVIGDLVRVLAVGLNGVLPIVAGLIEGVSVVVTPLIDLIADIPTPILAAVIGFGAMSTVIVPLTTFVGTLTAAMKLSGTAIGVVGLQLKAAFITNPVGLALLAITGAAAILIGVFAAAAEKTAKANETAKGYRDTLVATTGAIGETTEAMVRKNLIDEKADELAKKVGVSFETVVKAAMGNTAAIGELDSATKNYTIAQDEQNKSQSVVADILNENSRAGKNLTTVVGLQRDALAQAREEQRRFRDEVNQASDAMTDAERSNGKLNDALAIARDTSKDATERIKALRQAIDELKGGTLTAIEAQAAMSSMNLDLAEAFALTNENGELLFKTVVDGAGKLDLSSRAGLNLNDQMLRASDGMLQAMQSASDLAKANGDTAGAQDAATAAGKAYEDQLYLTLKAAGLTDEQAQGLIATYLATPEVVATLITDNGSIDSVNQGLLSLAEQIMKTPDKSITLSEPFSPEIMENLANLGFTVTTLPDGRVNVSAAGVEAAEAAITNLVRSRTVQVNFLAAPGAAFNQAPPGIARPSANGNIFEGGTQAFANGGFPSGIYKGRPGGIHKFAEAETVREAFISDKPGQKSRNLDILARVAQWFDAEVVPVGGSRNTSGAFTGSPTSSPTSPPPAGNTSHQTVNYYAAPNTSLDSTRDLQKAMQKGKVYGW